MQAALVALQCHDAVAPLLDDRLGDGALAVECVDGDECSRPSE